MAGYTDAVVLEAPVFWWPSLGDVSLYPLDPTQSLLAALTDAPMTWPTVVAAPLAPSSSSSSSSPPSPPPLRTVGLSRLGRSLCLTAAWAAEEEGDAQPFLSLWSPMTATTVHLPVCTTAGLGGRGGSWSAITALDIRQLVRENRIRLTHRALPRSLCLTPPPSSSGARLLATYQRRVEGDLSYPLLGHRLATAHRSAHAYLQRVVGRQTASTSRNLRGRNCGDGDGDGGAEGSSDACFSPPHSVLFTGDTASQRHLVRLLRRGTPPLLPVGERHVCALDVRRVSMAELLTLTEHEALDTLEVLLRPPPLPHAESPAVASPPPSSVSLVPCLLVVLEGLELLQAGANALVAGVTHQLCMGLDTLGNSPVPALLWAFAEDVGALPVSLLSRVAAVHLGLSNTTAEERAAYFASRLRKTLNGKQSGDVGPSTSAGAAAACTPSVCLAMAEETAHWSVDRLVQLSNTELAQLCATSAAPNAAAVPTSALTQPRGTPSPNADVAEKETECLHPVYRHLYGIEDDLRRVEELVVWPLTHLSLLRELSIPCAKGVLVCGPSGCGKTALLACLVRRLRLPDIRGLHVMSVDGLSLIEKEVGRSEKNIATLFETARQLAPTALFIDNLDALAPPRGRSTAETNTTADRTLSTLLTQMDGVGGGQANGVVVVVASAPSAATLDPAVCRPGRLDVHVHLHTPPLAASAAFMKARLTEFATRVRSDAVGLGKDGKAGSAESTSATTTTATIHTLVDRFLESPSAGRREAPGGGGGVAFSPAEAAAAIREVMLHVAEHFPRTAAAGGKGSGGTAVTESDLQSCLCSAFEKL